MEQNFDGKAVAEVMEALRAAGVLAIAHELAPIIEASSDRELAQRIAGEAAIAAARAIQPAYQRIETYLLVAVQLQMNLDIAEKVIAAFSLRRGEA